MAKKEDLPKSIRVQLGISRNCIHEARKYLLMSNGISLWCHGSYEFTLPPHYSNSCLGCLEFFFKCAGAIDTIWVARSSPTVQSHYARLEAHRTCCYNLTCYYLDLLSNLYARVATLNEVPTNTSLGNIGVVVWQPKLGSFDVIEFFATPPRKR